MVDIYGKGKSEFISAVQQRVLTQTAELGIIVEKIYLIGELRLPPSVTASINAKIEATQKTSQRENEVAQSMAEADKKLAEAVGIASSQLAIAKANSEAINLEGDALRNNPLVLELRKIEKWNGSVPQVVGIDQIFPFVPAKQVFEPLIDIARQVFYDVQEINIGLESSGHDVSEIESLLAIRGQIGGKQNGLNRF